MKKSLLAAIFISPIILFHCSTYKSTINIKNPKIEEICFTDKCVKKTILGNYKTLTCENLVLTSYQDTTIDSVSINHNTYFPRTNFPSEHYKNKELPEDYQIFINSSGRTIDIADYQKFFSLFFQ